MVKNNKSSAHSLKRIQATIENNFAAHLEKCRAFLRQKNVSVTREGMLANVFSPICVMKNFGSCHLSFARFNPAEG